MIYKTAEAVSPAHPDKLCDQISDIILDLYLEKDKDSRVAVEVCGGHGDIYITGEITSKATISEDTIIEAAEKVLADNRYDPSGYYITTNIVKQSPNIAKGVDTGGAGDQGIMVGYATNETAELIPLELSLARQILKHLWETNEKTRDAKCQITTKNGVVDTVVVSAERLTSPEIATAIRYVLGYQVKNARLHINPAGEWSNGGFEADAGVTGRKLAVDNYGPQVEIGGGAFSGKDYTKVDRSGAYIARKIAVSAIKDTGANWAKVKVAYSIGVPKPVMLTIETDKGLIDGADILETLTPANIRKELKLDSQKYYETAKWGHFGNDFIWDNHLT